MATIPTSVRFRKNNEERLKKFLTDTPSLSAKDLIDFAVQDLFEQLDAGAEIRITKDGLRLVRAMSEQAYLIGQKSLEKLEKREAEVSKPGK